MEGGSCMGGWWRARRTSGCGDGGEAGPRAWAAVRQTGADHPSAPAWGSPSERQGSEAPGEAGTLASQNGPSRTHAQRSTSGIGAHNAREQRHQKQEHARSAVGSLGAAQRRGAASRPLDVLRSHDASTSSRRCARCSPPRRVPASGATWPQPRMSPRRDRAKQDHD